MINWKKTVNAASRLSYECAHWWQLYNDQAGVDLESRPTNSSQTPAGVRAAYYQQFTVDVSDIIEHVSPTSGGPGQTRSSDHPIITHTRHTATYSSHK